MIYPVDRKNDCMVGYDKALENELAPQVRGNRKQSRALQ
jgi:hypothetical protein